MRCRASLFPVSVWKGEYNAAVTDALYVEARVGGYLSDAGRDIQEHGAAHRGHRREHGQRRRAVAASDAINRPQVNGSVSF